MAGAVFLLLSALAYAVLLEVLRRRDEAYPSTDPTESTWWFGYARDLANAIGWLVYSGGLALLGFPVAHALFLGGLLTLLGYGVDYLVGRTTSVRRPALVVAALLLAVVSAVVALRAPLARGMRALEVLLF